MKNELNKKLIAQVNNGYKAEEEYLKLHKTQERLLNLINGTIKTHQQNKFEGGDIGGSPLIPTGNLISARQQPSGDILNHSKTTQQLRNVGGLPHLRKMSIMFPQSKPQLQEAGSHNLQRAQSMLRLGTGARGARRESTLTQIRSSIMYSEGAEELSELQEKLKMKKRGDLVNIESKTKKKSKSRVRTHRVIESKVKPK